MVKNAMQTFKRNNMMLIVTLASYISRHNDKVHVDVLDFDNLTIHVFYLDRTGDKSIKLNQQSNPMHIAEVLEALERMNVEIRSTSRTKQLFEAAMRKLSAPEIKAVLEIFRKESVQKV